MGVRWLVTAVAGIRHHYITSLVSTVTPRVGTTTRIYAIYLLYLYIIIPLYYMWISKAVNEILQQDENISSLMLAQYNDDCCLHVCAPTCPWSIVNRDTMEY